MGAQLSRHEDETIESRIDELEHGAYLEGFNDAKEQAAKVTREQSEIYGLAEEKALQDKEGGVVVACCKFGKGEFDKHADVLSAMQPEAKR
jgi:hypothetical protein